MRGPPKGSGTWPCPSAFRWASLSLDPPYEIGRCSMSHVVLLGDSIFDNARYVPDHPAVIDQLRRGLSAGWKATLLAVDGSCLDHIPEQLGNIPDDATHLVVSVGG